MTEKSVPLNLAMKPELFMYFIAGVTLGFIFDSYFLDESEESSHLINSFSFWETDVKLTGNPKSIKEIQNIRILCMVNTHPDNHYKKAVHVKETWGRHCDKLIFGSTLTDEKLNAIGFNITNSHSYVWGKQKRMFQYIYNNFYSEYDWFYKADDDTYANIENLRFLLSSYSTEDPIFFGHKFNTSSHKYGYFSGGAGNLNVNNILRRQIIF